MLVLSPAHAPADAQRLRQAIERASGLRVELVVAPSGDEAVGMVQAGRADAGLLPLFDYLYCAELFHVEPLLQVLRHGAQADYQAELVVRADSSVRDLAGLGGKAVGFVDRYSVTGFLLPAKMLRDAGVVVEVRWLGSHEAVVAAVRDASVAAGASYRGHAEGRTDLRVLDRSTSVANEPIFVQAALSPSTRGALAKGLSAVAADATLLAGLADATGLRDVVPGTYEAAREVVAAAGRSVEDMVPGGWVRANEHRRPLWSYGP